MCAMHCKIILARLQPEINLDHKMDFDQRTSFPEGHLYISLTECLLTVAHCPFKWIELSWTVQQNKMHWAQKTLKVEKYLRKVNWTSPYWRFMFIAPKVMAHMSSQMSVLSQAKFWVKFYEFVGYYLYFWALYLIFEKYNKNCVSLDKLCDALTYLECHMLNKDNKDRRQDRKPDRTTVQIFSQTIFFRILQNVASEV